MRFMIFCNLSRDQVKRVARRAKYGYWLMQCFGL